jgi:hypothetical protein
LVSIAVMPSDTYIKTLVIDDALYYPVIAKSIALGEGSSYDGGLTHTNGCHPLWCWLIVPLAKLCSRMPPLDYLWYIKLLMLGVIAILYYVWFRLVREVFQHTLPAAIFLLLMGGYWWSLTNLFSMLETPLVMLLAGISLLLARRLLRAERVRWPVAVGLGAAVAGTFLARLDSIFFLACLAVGIGVPLIRRRREKSLLWVAITALALVAPYLLWNLTQFGHVVPVSGLAKMVGLDVLPRLRVYCHFWFDKGVKFYGLFGLPGTILATLLTAGGIFTIRRELRRALTRSWGLLWILPTSAVIHSVYTWLFMRKGAVSWYHYLSYLTVFLVVATVAQTLHERLLSLRLRATDVLLTGGLLLLLGVTLVLYAPRKLPHSGSVVTYELAVWARENLPETARLGMYDSGIVRFVSGRKVVSLNGLAGDVELMEMAMKRDLRGMIQRYDLDYVITSLTVEKLDALASAHIVYISPTVQMPDRGPCRYVIAAAEAYLDPAFELPAR